MAGVSFRLAPGVRWHGGLLTSFLVLMVVACWACVLGCGYILYALLIWPTRTLMRRYG